MQELCPITDKRINEKVARLNALITLLIVVSFLLFDFWAGIIILTADFIIRGFIDAKYSPICYISSRVVKLLNLERKMINAGPKIFAAQVGAVLSFILLALLLTKFKGAVVAVAFILVLFSFLETAMGYCVACKLYPYFRRK